MILALWNNQSGLHNEDTKLADELDRLKQTHDVQIFNVSEFQSENIPRGVTHVLAIGGDGTVNTAAALAMHNNVPLAVIPTGTFNHFAVHNNIPRDITAAFKVFEDGEHQFVDLGRVHDRIFCNFVSIGLYANIVHGRTEAERAGGAKWPNFVRVFAHEFRTMKRMRTTVTTGSTSRTARTPLIFIGNGRYRFGSLDLLHTRDSVAEQRLHVLTLRNMSRSRIAWSIALSMAYDTTRTTMFDAVTLSHCSIDILGATSCAVSLDGEAVTLPVPLHFSVLPRALTLMVPKKRAGTE